MYVRIIISVAGIAIIRLKWKKNKKNKKIDRQ